MVKETTVQAYICDKCGKTYLNKSEAENCESSHGNEMEENLSEISESVYA